MKKLLTLISLLMVCLTLGLGQSIAADVQQEWTELCDMLNSAVREFGYIAPSRAGGD